MYTKLNNASTVLLLDIFVLILVFVRQWKPFYTCRLQKVHGPVSSHGEHFVLADGGVSHGRRRQDHGGRAEVLTPLGSQSGSVATSHSSRTAHAQYSRERSFMMAHFK